MDEGGGQLVAGENRPGALTTLGKAGIEVAQNVLAETRYAILPLAPDFDTLRWIFIAVALGGFAVTIHTRLDDWRRGRR